MYTELKNFLFEEAHRTHTQLYAIVDSAVDGMIDGHFESDEPKKQILYRDEEDRRTLELKAPHLIVLEKEHPFTERLFREGYGKHWGCFLFSKENLPTLADHLSNYTKVYSTEHQQDVYVRFYDPRAMGQYFPLFDKEEAKAFFTHIEAIAVEDAKNPKVLYTYSLHKQSEQIQREEKDLEAMV